MAHPYDLNQYSQTHHRVRRPITHHRHFHFIAALLLAAIVLVVTLGVRNHKPAPQPQQPQFGDYGSTPATAPR